MGKTKHPCDQCDKCYSNSGTLSRHKAVTHRGQRWTCCVCRTQFCRNETLQQHLESKHADRDIPSSTQLSLMDEINAPSTSAPRDVPPTPPACAANMDNPGYPEGSDTPPPTFRDTTGLPRPSPSYTHGLGSSLFWNLQTSSERPIVAKFLLLPADAERVRGFIESDNLWYRGLSPPDATEVQFNPATSSQLDRPTNLPHLGTPTPHLGQGQNASRTASGYTINLEAFEEILNAFDTDRATNTLPSD